MSITTVLYGRGDESLAFDGVGAVLTSVSLGTPETRRPVTSLSGGGAIPGEAIPGTRRVVLRGVLMARGSTAALRAADGFRLRRLLCRITDPEFPFVMERDGYDLTLYADGGPSFSSEAPGSGPDAFGFTLTADAYDPFFRCPQTAVSWSVGSGVSSGNVNLANAGDVRCGAVFTVTAGSGADNLCLTLTNTTTGEQFAMATGLSAGEVMVLDTRPGHRGLSVTSGGTTADALLRMDWTKSFPTFVPGANGLTWSVSGTGGATVSTVLHPGWLTA